MDTDRRWGRTAALRDSLPIGCALEIEMMGAEDEMRSMFVRIYGLILPFRKLIADRVLSLIILRATG
jgi:hypothetical protein